MSDKRLGLSLILLIAAVFIHCSFVIIGWHFGDGVSREVNTVVNGIFALISAVRIAVRVELIR